MEDGGDELKTTTVFRVFMVERENLAPSGQQQQAQCPHQYSHTVQLRPGFCFGKYSLKYNHIHVLKSTVNKVKGGTGKISFLCRSCGKR